MQNKDTLLIARKHLEAAKHHRKFSKDEHVHIELINSIEALLSHLEDERAQRMKAFGNVVAG